MRILLRNTILFCVGNHVISKSTQDLLIFYKYQIEITLKFIDFLCHDYYLSQMLREGKSKSCVESPAFVPITSKRKPAGGRCRNSDSEPEPEGYVPAPTFSQSFSDAIALAIEKAVANKETPEGKL
jgi:hypothetical protein